MKKLIALTAIAGMLVIAGGPALTVAQEASTGLTRGSGGGTPPIIKAKWEMNGPCFTGNNNDVWDDCANVGSEHGSNTGEGADDSTDPGAQFNAPGEFESNMNYTICAIATDPNGPDDIAGVYADIYYPEGISYHPEDPDNPDQVGNNAGQPNNPDYGLSACGAFIEQNTLHKLDKEDGIDLFCNQIRNNNNNLPEFYEFPSGSDFYDYDEICGPTGELEKEEAHVYCDDKQLWYEWPAGDYRAEVIAQDAAGNSSTQNSNVGEDGVTANLFEYLPLTEFAVDFTSVNYGEVLLNTKKILSGDLDMTTSARPTVRNLGNTRLYMWVAQDDMGLGQTSGNWNVSYEARLGNRSADWRSYDPFDFEGAGSPTFSGDYERLQDILDLSEDEELDFSILVTKWPTTASDWNGDMWLTASQAAFRQCNADTFPI